MVKNKLKRLHNVWLLLCNVLDKQNYREREQISSCQMIGMEGRTCGYQGSLVVERFILNYGSYIGLCIKLYRTIDTHTQRACKIGEN